MRRIDAYLVHVQRPNAQRINHVSASRRSLPPLLHLHGAHVMRRIDIAGIPPPRHLLQVIVRVLQVAQLLDIRLLVPQRLLAIALKPSQQAGRDIAGGVRRARAGIGGSCRAGAVDGEEAAAG